MRRNATDSKSGARWTRSLGAAVPLALLAACATVHPDDASAPPAAESSARDEQARFYPGVTEDELLAAGASVLQELGFTIDETWSGPGTLVAAAERSAINKAEVASMYAKSALEIAMALVAMPPLTVMPYAKRQELRVSLTTRPAPDSLPGAEATLVRMSIERTVYDYYGFVMRLEQLTAPEIYQQFYDRLSQEVFPQLRPP
jgi:hypothetical protein